MHGLCSNGDAHSHTLGQKCLETLAACTNSIAYYRLVRVHLVTYSVCYFMQLYHSRCIFQNSTFTFRCNVHQVDLKLYNSNQTWFNENCFLNILLMLWKYLCIIQISWQFSVNHYKKLFYYCMWALCLIINYRLKIVLKKLVQTLISIILHEGHR